MSMPGADAPDHRLSRATSWTPASWTPVTWIIVVATLGIAALQLFDTYDDATEEFGAHPALVAFGLFPVGLDTLHVARNLATSLFLHNGLAPAIVSMLFLHGFGRTVERAMGSLRYALFYVLCGVAGGLVYCLANAWSAIPLVGASGAVSGVIAAHTLLLPWSDIRSFGRRIALPAWIYTGAWFLLVVLSQMVGWYGLGLLSCLGGAAAGTMLAPLFSRPGALLLARPWDDPEHADAFGDGYRLPGRAKLVFALLPVIGLGAWLLGVDSLSDKDTRAIGRESVALAQIYGEGVPKRPDSGLALYRQAAEEAPGVAARLGKLLLAGRRVPRDEIEAMKWLGRAAEQKHPDGLEIYAMALVKGEGVPRDPERGVAMLQELTLQGYAVGDLQLGLISEQGIGGAGINPESAARYYRQACENIGWRTALRRGKGAGCYHWALMAFSGRGTPKDAAKARQLLESAVQFDRLPEAENALGLLLATGDPESADIGPEPRPDDGRAHEMFERAAKAGNADAMFNLARLSDQRRNSPKALPREDIGYWYDRSASAGNERAKAALERLK